MAFAFTKRNFYWLLAIVGAAGVAAVGIGSQPPSAPSQKEAQAFQDLRAAAQLATTIRNQLKNPGSFELVEAGIGQSGGLCLTYRATNSFNATVTAQAVAVGRQSNNIFLTSEGDRKAFEKAWKKSCQAEAVRVETRSVQRLMT